MASRVVIRVNRESLEATVHRGVLVVRVGRAEDTHHGVAVASRVNQVAILQAHGAAASRVRAVVDQERVESLEGGVQVHLAVIHTNLAMAKDTQMEEVMIVDTTVDMVVIQAAQEVGHPAVNLGRAAAALRGLAVERVGNRAVVRLGLAAERVASLEAIHLHRALQDLGIHQVVPTLNHHTQNLLTVVVLRMTDTGTLVDMEANGTRGHLHLAVEVGHLVASRGRAEEVLAHLGDHRRVNLANLDTEILKKSLHKNQERVTYVPVGYNKLP